MPSDWPWQAPLPGVTIAVTPGIAGLLLAGAVAFFCSCFIFAKKRNEEEERQERPMTMQLALTSTEVPPEPGAIDWSETASGPSSSTVSDVSVGHLSEFELPSDDIPPPTGAPPLDVPTEEIPNTSSSPDAPPDRPGNG
jgi:hypothetical protein